MAESSTCLVRSFSTPADTSCATHEGDPLRALGESISFGRFMSENLDWEKWSAFSQKRYVEEAEKYSKPGSVAAKKAYFEAHYKRKAAEKAAALIQEETVQADGTFDSESREEKCTDSFIQVKSEADNVETADEQINKDDNVNYQGVDCDGTNTNQYKCDVEQNDFVISEVERVENTPHTRDDTNLNVESCVLVDNSHQLDHIEVRENITIPAEERAPDPGIAGQEILALLVKRREVNSSPKSSTTTTAVKLSNSRDERKAAAAVPPRNGIKSVSKGKIYIGDDAVEKKRVLSRSLRTSINLPPSTGETNKTAAAGLQSRNGLNSLSPNKKSVRGSVEMKRSTASSLHMSINVPSGSGVASKTIATGVKPRNGTNIAPKIMKSVGASMEKRPTARSLHMSINLPSGGGETSKTASKVFEHNRNKKVRCNSPKDHPVASRTSTQASHGLLNQASANLPSQGRRTGRLLNNCVSGSVTVNAKLSSLSVDCLKSSCTTKSNPRSSTISSPFRFRSEERAIKRKEFMQRINETKSKEEEKVQLQRIPKGNPEPGLKKLQQSSGSVSKLNEDGPSGSQSPSNQIRKASLAFPRSPKSVKKGSLGAVSDKKLGNAWKPPISTHNSKRITEKITRTRQSGSSLSNTTQENASPNIQH